MMMMLMEMVMEMPPPTPRRSAGDDGLDFPFSGGLRAAGSALSQSRRGLLPPPPPLKIVEKLWRTFFRDTEHPI